MSVMALRITAVLFLIGCLSVSNAGESDIRCLKAIKSSFADPLGHLKNSWIFNNQTEDLICQFPGVYCWTSGTNVLSLSLSGMGLKGFFPTGIKYCTSLTALDLSNNQLSGPIPSDISNLLPFVTSLDLSHNYFSGEIPKSIGNCIYLNSLLLDHNRLTGQLPDEISMLSRLSLLDVSNNNLPERERQTSVTESDDSFKLGFIIAYLISAAAVFIMCSMLSSSQLKMVAMLILSSVSTMVKKNSKKRNDEPLEFPSLKHRSEMQQLEKLVNRMSYAELYKTTDSFSDKNIIGKGKLGTLYKATLPNGWFLAVKRVIRIPESENQMVSEMLALGKMRHQNLIPLLGFRKERDERVLVYEHMSNGNLYDCLHPPIIQSEAKILQWPLRVKIAMGTARGLVWLHHKCIFRVVHRRITSKAILLDRCFEPKISNFECSIISNDGGAMFVYSNDNDSGLLVNSGSWELDFVKKDVYDYGIVLLELITGKDTKTSGSSVSVSLRDTLMKWIEEVSRSKSSIMNEAIVDKHLMGQGIDEEIFQMLRIACECLHPLPYQRPKMLEVYQMISNIGQRYGFPSDSGLLFQPIRA